MKIFVDSANLNDIEEALKHGFPKGITTNPSILSKEEKCDFKEHVQKIISLLDRYEYHIPLSVEVFTNDPKEMLRQSEEFIKHFGNYPYLNIKVPIGWNELEVISELKKRGIRVNCTCCMSLNQAIMAAEAGADFVSLFYNRIRDVGYDAKVVVENVCSLFKQWDVPAQVIVGSIRHIYDVNEAFLAGTDIVTIPTKFFPQLSAHPKTDEAVSQFISDFQDWTQAK